jgi:hypothetical protein
MFSNLSIIYYSSQFDLDPYTENEINRLLRNSGTHLRKSAASHPTRPNSSIYTVTRFKPNLDGVFKPPRNQDSELIFLTGFHVILITVKFMVIRVKEMYMTHNKFEIYSCKMTHYHSPEHRCRWGVDVKLGNGV